MLSCILQNGHSKNQISIMKKLILSSLATFFIATTLQAKIWRVNNNAGIVADVTSPATLFDGTNTMANPEAANGDIIHIEPSATTYAFFTVNKQVTIIGNGFFLSGAGSNPGLQENTLTSKLTTLRFNTGSAGTKIIGIELTATIDFTSGYSGNVDLVFEKCFIPQGSAITFVGGLTYSNIAFRKCRFAGINMSVTSSTINNFTVENCIMVGNVFWIKPAAATNFVVRNNTFDVSSNPAVDFNNAYVANNIFLVGSSSNNFNSCIVKNNLFTNNQTGITVGPLSTNGNNLISQTLASIITNTGTNDTKYQLAGGSPAIGGGVDISGQKPDCGAFGGNDPYKLSGIPGIPTIYGLTVPANIATGQTTMTVNISTRNNN
jgi:hypothetical protein